MTIFFNSKYFLDIDLSVPVSALLEDGYSPVAIIIALSFFVFALAVAFAQVLRSQTKEP